MENKIFSVDCIFTRRIISKGLNILVLLFTVTFFLSISYKFKIEGIVFILPFLLSIKFWKNRFFDLLRLQFGTIRIKEIKESKVNKIIKDLNLFSIFLYLNISVSLFGTIFGLFLIYTEGFTGINSYWEAIELIMILGAELFVIKQFNEIKRIISSYFERKIENKRYHF